MTFHFYPITIINLGVTHLHQYHNKCTCNLKHMVLAKHGRLLKYWCGKACCNLIKIRSLIAPDYVAHSFMRDNAKPGAINDRILIRLSLLLHGKKKKMYGKYRGGRGGLPQKRYKPHFVLLFGSSLLSSSSKAWCAPNITMSDCCLTPHEWLCSYI